MEKLPAYNSGNREQHADNIPRPAKSGKLAAVGCLLLFSTTQALQEIQGPRMKVSNYHPEITSRVSL